MTLAEIVARNLKAKRGSLAQDEFASRLGISRSVLVQLEEASPETTIDTLEQITNALRCHVRDLLKATDQAGKWIRHHFRSIFACAPVATFKPKHEIPKGAKVEREIRVDVQPTGRPDCPLCTVDLSLVKVPDATHRVVASSPTGEVLNTLDVPRAPALLERPKNWSAGVLYNGRWGGLVARDFDWISIGAAVTTNRDGGVDPWGMLVVRF